MTFVLLRPALDWREALENPADVHVRRPVMQCAQVNHGSAARNTFHFSLKGRLATHACQIVWTFTHHGTGEDRAGAKQLSQRCNRRTVRARARGLERLHSHRRCHLIAVRTLDPPGARPPAIAAAPPPELGHGSTARPCECPFPRWGRGAEAKARAARAVWPDRAVSSVRGRGRSLGRNTTTKISLFHRQAMCMLWLRSATG